MPRIQLMDRHVRLLQKFLEKMELRLLHATRIENLASILEQGLIPISHAKFSGLDKAKTNDSTRYLHGANCLSVGWPNTKTLASWGPIGSFALIEIESTILLKKPWFSFPTNSSSKECLDAYVSNPVAFCGVDALANLFLDTAVTNTGRELNRESLGIPIGFPNDPQAEIAIDELIEPWWFNKIIFPTVATLERFTSLDINHKIDNLVCDPKAFAPRFDLRMWARGERVSLAEWQRSTV
jgi:hypothetical protein